MVPNFAPWLTDFRTVFVFALGPFLPMFVIFFGFNGNFNGKMEKNRFLAIKSSRTNSGKWGIPEKSYKNVAQR